MPKIKFSDYIANYDNYIFDMDGTIINSSREVLACLKKAFKQANFVVDNSRFTSDVIGPPLIDIIKSIAPELDDDMANLIMKNFRLIYDYSENDVSFMYDGMYDFLISLKNKGKKLFIATYKPEIPTLRLVDKFSLDMFMDVYTIDKFGRQITKEEMINDILNKFSLDKSKTVMIGDAKSDVVAAKKAGVTAVGVLWGYGSNKTPLIENSDFVLEGMVK